VWGRVEEKKITEKRIKRPLLPFQVLLVSFLKLSQKYLGVWMCAKHFLLQTQRRRDEGRL